MPKVRKLSLDEVRTIENKGKGQRKLVEEQYDAIISDYAIGDYGEAELDPGENRLTVRNRIKAAAGRRKLAIEFKRTRGDVIRFKVLEAIEKAPPAPKVDVPIEPPSSIRRGRRKKVV